MNHSPLRLQSLGAPWPIAVSENTDVEVFGIQREKAYLSCAEDCAAFLGRRNRERILRTPGSNSRPKRDSDSTSQSVGLPGRCFVLRQPRTELPSSVSLSLPRSRFSSRPFPPSRPDLVLDPAHPPLPGPGASRLQPSEPFLLRAAGHPGHRDQGLSDNVCRCSGASPRSSRNSSRSVEASRYTYLPFVSRIVRTPAFIPKPFRVRLPSRIIELHVVVQIEPTDEVARGEAQLIDESWALRLDVIPRARQLREPRIDPGHPRPYTPRHPGPPAKPGSPRECLLCVASSANDRRPL